MCFVFSDISRRVDSGEKIVERTGVILFRYLFGTLAVLDELLLRAYRQAGRRVYLM